MKQKKISKEITAISKKIISEYRPEQLILFGSHAWGVPHQDSDIDFFIIKKTKDTRLERAQRVHTLLWGTCMPVDVLIYTPEEVKRRLRKGDFFVRDVVDKGRTLYKKR